MYVTDNIKIAEKAVKQLTKARSYIDKEGGFTKNTMARAVNGNPIENYAYATCFCTLGAIDNATNKSKKGVWNQPATEYMSVIMTDNIPKANDSRSTKQEHVLMAFDFAILMAQDDLKAAQKRNK